MRLNWFLPMIRRPRDGIRQLKRRRLVETLRRILPAACSSDWTTKRRGLGRTFLRRQGLSWLASPVRRVVQSVCLVTFLILFFYVCWPYDARPAQSWPGFIPISVDAVSGRATLTGNETTTDLLQPGSRLHASDASDQAQLVTLGRFEIVSVAENSVELSPVEKLSDDILAAMALSTGPWSLSREPLQLWPNHYANNLARKEKIAAEFFLVIDPLVSFSTAVASRSWVWSLTSAVIILVVCVVVPRGFCGYLCPLGTTIDLFDALIGKRFTRFRVPDDGWWVHVKYYLLLAILVAAVSGVLISGFFAAIPVITRGLMFTVAPLQTGWSVGWHQMPPMHSGHWLSITLFFTVLGLGVLKPRFWCKYVCPSGAVFSRGNLFRVSQRKVESRCIHCNKCVEICPFDAIKPDFTTRTTDCTLCQSCGGVCPTHAIKFVGRWEIAGLKSANDPPTGETPIGRRGFVATGVGLLTATAAGAATAGATSLLGARLDRANSPRPIRPPGSVAEEEFLQKCIRCAECFKVCPSDVLQPLGFLQGLEGLWTPHVVADWAGCASSCNNCGQVCPTGAIRALSLEEKKSTRIGLAIVDSNSCLPLAGREACQLCVDECNAAGYHAIEFVQVRTEVDATGMPIEGTGFLAPVVVAEKCVGCGLCQTRCYGINVAAKKLLMESAIVIKTGPGLEDR